MNPYEEFVKQFRKCGAYYNAPSPELGVMKKGGRIKLDTMELDTEDYLMDCSLALDGDGDGENVLKEGDKVLVLKMQDQETYILLAKVVDPK